MSNLRSRRKALARRLATAGFPDGKDEVNDLLEAAGDDLALVNCWAERRLDGEPLPWLTGHTTFLDNRVRVDRGVYPPRPQTEPLARRAIELLPEDGVAVDLCTGSGAIAVALRNARPHARIVATDIDANAVRCAQNNGVEVYRGHLAEPVPDQLTGHVDVVVAVVPYVPTEELIFLPRDVRRHEPLLALDGGPDGTTLLEQVIRCSAELLRPNGSMLLELGGDQDELLQAQLDEAGLRLTTRLIDEDGDLRGIEATRQ